MRLGRVLAWAGAAAAAAVALAALVYDVGLLYRPRPLQRGSIEARHHSVRGAFHVHTTRSDGTGSPDQVAAAAAEADLDFVVLTDHGDATRPPDPPTYRHRVLCLDGIEISTTGGHYVALDMQEAPYPLGGEPSDVVEDVARLGGFGVVAHPGSAKYELRWREWTAPFDGIEWLNADSEWRDENRTSITRALLLYPLRGPQALTSLFDRPEGVLARWDALTRRRHVVALAGTDAHARIAGGSASDPDGTLPFIKLPSYRVAFETFSIRVQLDRPLTGTASADGASVVRALREGHVHSSLDALTVSERFSFQATSGSHSARQGDDLLLEGPVHLTIGADAPSGAALVLFRNGQPVQEVTGHRLDHIGAGLPAVFRAEVRLPGAPGKPPVPWIVSNPIYATASLAPRPTVEHPRPTASVATATAGWRVERDPTSTAEALRDLPAGAVGMRYRLGSGSAAGQFAAVMIPIDATILGFERIAFEGRAAGPSRVSVQLRSRARAGERWRRSVYLDSTSREVEVFLRQMVPADTVAPLPGSWLPALRDVDSVLIVVDTVNTKPGSEGSIELVNLHFAR